MAGEILSPSIQTVTVPVAAARLGVSTDSIRRWVEQGVLRGSSWPSPSGGKRRKLLIDASSINDALNRYMDQP